MRSAGAADGAHLFAAIVLGLLAGLAALALSFQAAAAAPQPTDAAAVRAETLKVYDWAGYQRDLPDGPAPRRPPADKPHSVDLGTFANTMMIGLVVAGLAIAAMTLYAGGFAPLFGPAVAKPADSAPEAARRSQLETRLHDADRSAEAGDLASAIHTLLLTSIDLLHRRVGQEVPVAMTGRELIGHARVTDRARDDFAALVAAAELCHFGGRSADRALYERCRVHYERLWGIAPEAAA